MKFADIDGVKVPVNGRYSYTYKGVFFNRIMIPSIKGEENLPDGEITTALQNLRIENGNSFELGFRVIVNLL